MTVAAFTALIAATGASFAQDFGRRPPVSSVAPSLQCQKAYDFLAPSTVVNRDADGPDATMSVRRPRPEHADR